MPVYALRMYFYIRHHFKHPKTPTPTPTQPPRARRRPRTSPGGTNSDEAMTRRMGTIVTSARRVGIQKNANNQQLWPQ